MFKINKYYLCQKILVLKMRFLIYILCFFSVNLLFAQGHHHGPGGHTHGNEQPDEEQKENKKNNTKTDANSGATWDASSMMGKAKGSVYGIITDKNAERLQFATVTLYSVKEGEDKLIEGVITDAKGYFKLEDIPMGSSYIIVDYLGYKTKKKEFVLSFKNKDLNLKNISLEASSKQISTVKVVDKAPLYQNKMEKIIYNASEDVNSSADDAIDVLRKTPLLSVDLD